MRDGRQDIVFETDNLGKYRLHFGTAQVPVDRVHKGLFIVVYQETQLLQLILAVRYAARFSRQENPAQILNKRWYRVDRRRCEHGAGHVNGLGQERAVPCPRCQPPPLTPHTERPTAQLSATMLWAEKHMAEPKREVALRKA